MFLPDEASWRSLCGEPVVAVGATVLAYLAAVRLGRWSGQPLLNPTLVAILVVAGALHLTSVSYEAYAHGTETISFLLSPTVVLLAVPLYRQTPLILRSGRLIAASLAVGLPIGAASAVAIAWACGGSREILLSIVPKSVTAGIAIGISERIGGIPALTAVLVIATGIVGAVFGPTALRLLRVRDERVAGLALGIAGHGIATARALQMGEVAGAFAGLGMSLNGVLTALVFPAVVSLFR